MEENILEIFGKKFVENKGEFYLLYNNELLGNRPKTWNAIEEIIKSRWKGRICVRGLKGILRSKTKYNLTLEETIVHVGQLTEEGIYPECLTFNQSMPDEHLIIQGEVTRSTDFYDLTYTNIKKPMNIALKEETLFAKGLEAKSLLQRDMDLESYCNLQELFNCFPDSVIEFSCYERSVGKRGLNTVFWEVRNY